MDLQNTKCNICGDDFYSATKEKDYWICIGCGATLCPPVDSSREVKKQIIAAVEANGTNYIHIKAKKSGGRKSKGSNTKKEKMKRASTTALYKNLCN